MHARRRKERCPGEHPPTTMHLSLPAAVLQHIGRRSDGGGSPQGLGRQSHHGAQRLRLQVGTAPLLLLHEWRKVSAHELEAAECAVAHVRRVLAASAHIVEVYVRGEEHLVGVLLHVRLDLRLSLVEHGRVYLLLLDTIPYERLGGGLELLGDDAVVLDVPLEDHFGHSQSFGILQVHLAEAVAGEPKVQRVHAVLPLQKGPEEMGAVLVAQKKMQRLCPPDERRVGRRAALRFPESILVPARCGAGKRCCCCCGGLFNLALGSHFGRSAGAVAWRLTLLPRHRRTRSIFSEAAADVLRKRPAHGSSSARRVRVPSCLRWSSSLNPPHSLKAAGELLSSSSLWNTKYWSNQSQILLNFKEGHQVNSPFQIKRKERKARRVHREEKYERFPALHLSIYNLNERSTAAYILGAHWSVTSKRHFKKKPQKNKNNHLAALPRHSPKTIFS